MKRTISKCMILVALLSATIACKDKKQEDPVPASLAKKEALNDDWDMFIARYVEANGTHSYPFILQGSVDYTASNYEGKLCRAFPTIEYATANGFKNAAPLYQYYNRINGDNFYTTNLNELGNGNAVYKYYGISAFVIADNTGNNPSSLVPIYRYYNPIYGYHFYTNNANELSGKNMGYRYEGIAYYGAVLRY